MKYKNKLSVWMRNLLWFSCLSFLAFATSSCNDDDELENPYVKIGITIKKAEVRKDSLVGSDYIFKVAKTGISQDFFMYANIGDWILSVEESNQDWVIIYPNEGRDDGRFGIRVLPNGRAASRKASLYVIDSDGQVRGTLPIQQTGSDPYMDIDFAGVEKRSGYKGEEFTINVSANVAWYADNGGTEWIQLGEATETTQKIVIGVNSGTQERSGTLTFNMVGGTKKVAIQVIQADESSSYENATLTTIAQILSKLNGGVGTISDNVYIEAYVTNDITTKSIVSFGSQDKIWTQQTKLMTVQDGSKRGLLFQFNAESDNIYKLNDKLKIHMYGVSFAEDLQTGDIKSPAFSPVNIKEQVANSTGVAPVELNNMDNLNNYPNTLVTLKDIEFAIPYGTYMNIQESQINKIESWTATADPYADNTSDYGHVIRDKNGNLIKLYTAASFTEKYARIMPKGSGSITGIVMKRIKNNVKSNILRIRNDKDNQISDNAATAISTEIMKIGPWERPEALPAITSSVGTGILKQTSRSEQNVVTSGVTNLYWADAYQRITAGETAVMQMLNNQGWWKVPASILTSKTDEAGGEAWIITTSTAGSGATGKLFLQFVSSSSTSGPGIFTVEWADAEDTPAAGWKAIQDYYVCDVNNSKHRMEYCFPLPDEIKNKGTVTIRLRVKTNVRATNVNGTSTIGSSGSNCIGSIRITQLKN